MEILFKYLGEIQYPEVMSFILLILAFGDTVTSLMWRNKKGLSILSKKLWLGFAINTLAASVPYVVSRIPIFNMHDFFVNTALILWTLVFGVATGFSLAANYKLYSTESYEVLIKIVPQLFKAEIENKINKHVKKGEVND